MMIEKATGVFDRGPGGYFRAQLFCVVKIWAREMARPRPRASGNSRNSWIFICALIAIEARQAFPGIT
jgi:hypothetical protein